MNYESVLYCMINDFDCLTKALSKINESYFFDYKAQCLVKEIAHCAVENEKIDLSIVYSWVIGWIEPRRAYERRASSSSSIIISSAPLAARSKDVDDSLIGRDKRCLPHHIHILAHRSK